MRWNWGKAVGKLVVLALLVVGPGGAFSQAEEAEEADPLLVELSHFRVVPPEEEGDVETLAPLNEDETSRAGTVVEYVVAVENVSGEPADDVVLGLLVPPGTAYVEGGEKLDEALVLMQFSVDGGQTYRAPPVVYTARGEDGEEVRRVATADMYTHVRFVFLRPVAPGERLEFRYRVEVL